jgi:hypothetical protein
LAPVFRERPRIAGARTTRGAAAREEKLLYRWMNEALTTCAVTGSRRRHGGRLRARELRGNHPRVRHRETQRRWPERAVLARAHSLALAVFGGLFVGSMAYWKVFGM